MDDCIGGLRARAYDSLKLFPPDLILLEDKADYVKVYRVVI